MKILGSNCETVYFGVEFNDFNVWISEQKSALEKLKIKAQEGIKELFRFGDVYFEVLPHGRTPYSYILKNDQMTIKVSSRATRSFPELYIELRAEYNWAKGYRRAIDETCKMISNTVGVIRKVKFSRIDITVDETGYDFTDEDLKRFVTRAVAKTTSQTTYFCGRRFTGFRFGKGAIVVRIYDKTAEVEHSGKKWFRHLWEQKGWDGKSSVWRIEVQCRRDMLKEKLNDNDDIGVSCGQIGLLWRYVLKKWLRLAVPSNDTNFSRWKTDPIWEKLYNLEGFPEYNYLPVQQKQNRVAAESLVPGLLGYFSSLGAYLQIRDEEELINYIRCYLDSGFMQELERKSLLRNQERGGV